PDNYAEFDVRIADDQYSELNEAFIVEITGVKGSEAHVKPGCGSVTTTIVDDTQPWLPEYEEGTEGFDYIKGVHGEKTGALDGPVVTISGREFVSESSGSMLFQVIFSEVPVEDVTVTLCFTPDEGTAFGIADFIESGDVDELLALLNSLNTLAPNEALSPVFTNYIEKDGKVYVDVTISKEMSSSDLQFPVYNDHLSEDSEGFELSIDKLQGGEAQIGAESSFKSTIEDDGKGFIVGVQCYDPDRNGGQWVGDSTIEPNDGGNIMFKVFLTKPSCETDPDFPATAVENMTVTVDIRCSQSGYTGDKTVTINGEVKTVSFENGKATIKIGIAEGESEVVISLPKYDDDGDPATASPGQYWEAKITGTENCESYVGMNDYATAEIISGGNGPWTHIGLKVDPGSANNITDPEYANTTLTEEGTTADFLLTFGGEKHDPNDTGNIDKPLVITVQILGRGGDLGATAGGANSDFDMSTFAEENPHLENFSLDANGLLTFTIKAGTPYKDGISLKIPILAGDGIEPTEFYSIKLVNVKNSAGVTVGSVDRSGEDMGIISTDPGPKLSLHHTERATDDPEGTHTNPHDGTQTSLTDGQVIEGNTKTFYLELDQPVDGDFTIVLNYTGSGTNATDYGKDFVASPQTLWFKNGTAEGSGWELVDGKYRYEFKVSIPDDQYSEVNEQFTVSIKEVKGNTVTVDNDSKSVDTVIVDDGMSGPLVYFTTKEGSFAEVANGDINFEIILERPAAEPVTVLLKVTGGPGSIYGDDYSFDAPDGKPQYVQGSDGEWYLKVVVPAGTVQYKVTLEDVIKNDVGTEDPEDIYFTIHSVNGGETRIDTDNDRFTATITDENMDGPVVSVAAKDGVTSLNETDADSAEVTFVFTATGNRGSGDEVQEITVTFEIRPTTNVPLDRIFSKMPDGAKLTTDGKGYVVTVTIPTDKDSVEWAMKDLLDDHRDDRNPGKGFSVIIKNVDGNEATLGGGASASVTVVDDDIAPVAQNDKIIIMVDPANKNREVTIDLLDNDADGNNDALHTKTGSLNGTYGDYTINADGTLTYTLDPTMNITPNETFRDKTLEYTVTDRDTTQPGVGSDYNSDTANVDVDIRGVTNLTATKEDEWIFGTGKDDTINGNGGNDVIRAGGGKDTILVHADGKGRLYGEAGDDTFRITGTTGSTISLDACFASGSKAII
ncbi:VCBS domain-containing protein, partial [Desulfovibrio sp. OttesenSCG-928-I05]|nr:VCBS domain-containing protein [Desulfovibrio sp. OttesenSCG-928-I05]